MTREREKPSIISTPVLANEIKKLLPHQYPFLLVDRIIELEPGKYGKGIKNVTINEEFFHGHFPREPLMPGVLIVEAMAQVAGVVYLSQDIKESDGREFDYSDNIGYLVALKGMKFLKKVIPGDQLILKAKVIGDFGMLSQVAVSAEVNGETVVEGSISVSKKSGEDV